MKSACWIRTLLTRRDQHILQYGKAGFVRVLELSKRHRSPRAHGRLARQEGIDDGQLPLDDLKML